MSIKKILIGADVALINEFGKFSRADLDSELISLLEESDYRVFDLEIPLTDSNRKMPKSGPNIRMNTEMLWRIMELQPDLLVLANNHMMDYGAEGLLSTMMLLQQEKVETIGAGKGIVKNEHSIILNGKKFVFYACAEKEFVAEKGVTYVNVFSEKTINDIHLLKKQNDYVIIVYHGGIEHFEYPAPYLQSICHEMSVAGADLILCQHNHCIGVREHFNNTEILYGQGNFITGFKKGVVDFGLLVQIQVDEDGGINICYIPVKTVEGKVHLLGDSQAKEILDSLEYRSQDDFVDKYNKYCRDNLYRILQYCTGWPRIICKIDNHTGHYMLKRKYRKRNLLVLQNIVRCEAHRNILIDGIDIISGR